MDPQAAIRRYLARHAEPAAENLPAPLAGLRLCVVIPALAERARLPAVINSLRDSASHPGVAEALVVINHPASAPVAVVEDNAATLEQLRRGRWPLPVHPLVRVFDDALAPKGAAPRTPRAGVGAARRSGMDTALRRLCQAGAGAQGIIACLDADSPVGPGYVDAVLAAFAVHPAPLAGICAYRHPLPAEDWAARAIVVYELWLRYLELGMCAASSPFAFQTVGSTMVCSAAGYALADGMPRRVAAEDFYFLEKLAKLGGRGCIVDIEDARVFPEPRLSERVPFGTGRAMHLCRAEGLDRYLHVEPPEAFRDLGAFFAALPGAFNRVERALEAASAPLRHFLEARRAGQVLRRLRDNAPDSAHFLAAAHNWLGSLQLVRYARARRRACGGAWLFSAIAELAQEQTRQLPPVPDDSTHLANWITWLDLLQAPDFRRAIRNSLHTGAGGR